MELKLPGILMLTEFCGAFENVIKLSIKELNKQTFVLIVAVN